MWSRCSHHRHFSCWLLSAWLLASQLQAGDLSSDVRKGASGPDHRNGGYVEIGLGIESYTNPVVGWPEGNKKGEVHTKGFVDINARYQYHCLFAEIFSQSLEQFTLGCNAFNGENWALDIVGLAQHDEISESISDDYRGLHKRRADFMSGIRGTVYFENYILQTHALVDASNTHHGELYSVKLARHWQHRNWTIHGIVGATYRSQQINDYYFSIDECEVSEQFPQYKAPSSVSYIMELGATYPLSEKWVFRGFVRRLQIDSTVVSSPLILDDHGDIIATSVSYVF